MFVGSLEHDMILMDIGNGKLGMIKIMDLCQGQD